MGGRVKTLHPKLYAGLLALRDDQEHMAAARSTRSSSSTSCA
jgi:phosphoribosylaminoimidazolecarboxamide formyltransferase/IMP cyclohydrolase